MKSELRLRPHKYLPDAFVIEVWYAGQFIGTVAGEDGPGVRVISKHPLKMQALPSVVLRGKPLNAVKVTMLHEPESDR